MQARVAEFVFRPGPFSRKRKLRVDLHGASVFGPGPRHTLIRWEWMTDMRADAGVVICSPKSEIKFPDGAFDLPAQDLLALLQKARSIQGRSEVIGVLAGRSGN